MNKKEMAGLKEVSAEQYGLARPTHWKIGEMLIRQGLVKREARFAKGAWSIYVITEKGKKRVKS